MEHSRVMLESVWQPPSKPTKRKRASRACLPCHQSKVSCHDVRPCKRCVDRGCAAQCVEYESKRKSKIEQSAPPPMMNFTRELVPCSTDPSSAFRYTFNVMQNYIQTFKAPPSPVIMKMAVMMCVEEGLSQELISVLLDYVCQYGDANYKKDVSTVSTGKVFQKRPLPDHIDSRTASKLMSKSHLEFLPFAAVYSIFDGNGAVQYNWANSKLATMLQYTQEDCIKLLSESCCMSFFDPNLPPSVMETFDRHFLYEKTTFELQAAVISSQGHRIPVTVHASLDTMDHLRTALICLVPTSHSMLCAPPVSPIPSSSSSSYSRTPSMDTAEFLSSTTSSSISDYMGQSAPAESAYEATYLSPDSFGTNVPQTASPVDVQSQSPVYNVFNGSVDHVDCNPAPSSNADLYDSGFDSNVSVPFDVNLLHDYLNSPSLPPFFDLPPTPCTNSTVVAYDF